HFVEYVYNAAGDLTEFKDRLGQTTRYTYDPQKPHYLKDVTDRLGRKPVTTAYNTPGDGRLASLTDADGKVTALQYPVIEGTRYQHIIPPGTGPAAGRTTKLKFDVRGNVTETKVAYAMNGDNPVEMVTQATYSQDGKDRLTRTTQVVGAGGNDDI